MKLQFAKASFNTLFKIGVSLLALAFILYKIHQSPITPSHFDTFVTLKTIGIIAICTTLNWLFEILKWKTAIQTITPISFKKASIETFISYTYGLITPLNTGNYAKKILFYPDLPKTTIVSLNLTKGIYQMFATVIFGYWGFWYYPPFNLHLPNNLIFFVSIGTIGIMISIFIFRKSLNFFIRILPFSAHLKLLGLSILKYGCFSVLFMYLLSIHSVLNLSLFASVCTIYLFSSLVPIFNLLDFALKGTIAILILKPFGISDAYITVSYFILWLANHAAPALLGSLLQLKNLQR